MTFIKKIFENNVDDQVHRQFTRFGKGNFENRALVKIKKLKDKFTINTSYDFSYDLVRIFSDLIEEVDISGKLIKKRKKQDINEKVNSERLKELLEENDHCLLDMTSGDYTLKCKKSLPKPGGKTLNPKFCSACLPLEKLNDFAFDVKENFKTLEMSHTYIITELIIPERLCLTLT